MRTTQLNHAHIYHRDGEWINVMAVLEMRKGYYYLEYTHGMSTHADGRSVEGDIDYRITRDKRFYNASEVKFLGFVAS